MDTSKTTVMHVGTRGDLVEIAVFTPADATGAVLRRAAVFVGAIALGLMPTGCQIKLHEDRASA